jgi:hypothetical protein
MNILQRKPHHHPAPAHELFVCLIDFTKFDPMTRSFTAFFLLLLAGCVTQRTSTSTITTSEYDPARNETSYLVVPLGSAYIPGKWTKTHFNTVSNQQFFTNKDTIILALAFTPCTGYEFNTTGSKKGFDFVKAFYEWDSKYFVDQGLKRSVLETDSTNKFMIYRIYSESKGSLIDTYFLAGEKNGSASNFSITVTDKWTNDEKVAFLKKLFLTKKEG